VEKPEFIRLMEYTHHGSTINFKVPGRTAIRSRIMKMGEDTIEGTRKMFAVCLIKFLLDAGAILIPFRSWTLKSASLSMRGLPATSIPSSRL
jgi:hypothetical protein